ncbi:unnamed protein product [Caretta caretta]
MDYKNTISVLRFRKRQGEDRQTPRKAGIKLTGRRIRNLGDSGTTQVNRTSKKRNQVGSSSRNRIKQPVTFSTLLPKSQRHLERRRRRSLTIHLGVLLVTSSTHLKMWK